MANNAKREFIRAYTKKGGLLFLKSTLYIHWYIHIPVASLIYQSINVRIDMAGKII